MRHRKIAVIGIGNTLRRDDGIGIIILQSLLNFYRQDGIDYLDFGPASFDLIHRMRDYDSILIIDGINASLVPGELKIFALEEAEYSINGPAISTHELNLKGLFELYKNFEIKTRVYVAGIQVEDISFGEGLSQSLSQRLEEILKKIDLFITRGLTGNSPELGH